jgi:hypothetical protein
MFQAEGTMIGAFLSGFGRIAALPPVNGPAAGASQASGTRDHACIAGGPSA